ncbi:hypothetical protein BCV72DRAFT_237548 [Rhizopus microsporus var. microsporus]|uniref:Uncharacterized protein n=2 Tax=Rhizopus microsporus TaxID=58291 RepID=A0A2G4SZQ3_RHIZD|nr:uncharacterized protein RHIMIDRAFT_236234 [Rhizopus microsporus ATCC 52813]ORE12054.1 hypothetical protein BCV72DRAFT_237548 [Rhizopus microsporus var. microsporus]PHZ14253.1 hypothetical protein RHIMIDRAFT_236234 [Rhizopus microsporus ATCC 52813]
MFNNDQTMPNGFLQEPVAFEDFEFTLGYDFAVPIDFNELEDIPFNPEAHSHVLDEDERDMFNQFLDQFDTDGDVHMDPSAFSFPVQVDEDGLCESFLLHSLDDRNNVIEDSSEYEHGTSSLLKEATNRLGYLCSSTQSTGNISPGLNTSNTNHYGELTVPM